METEKERYKRLKSKDINKLNKFFQKNFEIVCKNVIGHEVTLKRDVDAIIFLTPPRHYTVDKGTVIRKGTRLKIIFFSFEPLGYSNDFLVEIVNPQIELEKISIRLESLAEAVRD